MDDKIKEVKNIVKKLKESQIRALELVEEIHHLTDYKEK